MKILIACEESQKVCTEFRKLGHEAYSCDIQEPSGGHPEWHINEDVLPLLNGNCTFHTMDGVEHSVIGKWDMLISFPPCTHLALSGAIHFEKKRADGRQRDAIEFFCQFMQADCDRILIENPRNIISGGEYIKTHFHFNNIGQILFLQKINYSFEVVVSVIFYLDFTFIFSA